MRFDVRLRRQTHHEQSMINRFTERFPFITYLQAR